MTPRSRGTGASLRASLLVALLLATAESLTAQVPKLTAEGRAGGWVPSGDVAASGATSGGAAPGASLGVGFAYAVRGGLYLHLGFGQHRLACDDGCSGTGDLSATGFDLALRYLLDTGVVKPWVRVGTLPYTVEGETSAPDGAKAVSDRVWGLEGGGGLWIQLAEHVALAPGVRYVALDPSWPESGDVELRGWVADLGLVWGF